MRLSWLVPALGSLVVGVASASAQVPSQPDDPTPAGTLWRRTDRPPQESYFDPINFSSWDGRWCVTGFADPLARNKLSRVVRFHADLQDDPVFAVGVGREFGGLPAGSGPARRDAVATTEQACSRRSLTMMTDLTRAATPIIRKLEYGALMSDDDRAAISNAAATTRTFRPREDIVRQGDRPKNVHAVLSGFACRYKMLPDGSRQIVALLVPGDLCDFHVHILGKMDHSIASVSVCEVAVLSRSVLDELIISRPAVARALWWASLVDAGTLREWLLSMGQRPAAEQMAHLFCELRVRLDSVGLVADDGYHLPLVQQELGELLGLSTVHVNRTLQELRVAGLIDWKGTQLQIRDLQRLEEFAQFDPDYLHLSSRSEA